MKVFKELEDYAMLKNLTEIVYNPGDYIFKENETSKGVYYLKEGNIKILKTDHRGSNMFLWFANADELIGITSFFDESGNHTCSALAGDKSCKMFYFPKSEFKEILTNNSSLKQKLLKMLCERISFIEKRTRSMMHQSTDQRIVDTLLFLMQKEKHGMDRNTGRIGYSWKQLSELVGASADYLRRRMKQLKDNHLIDYGRNWFTITDMRKLKASASVEV